MSYKCQQCGYVAKDGERPFKKVVETRQRTYKTKTKFGREKESTGWEVVKEIIVCRNCMENGNG